jgi:hypothetical protein
MTKPAIFVSALCIGLIATGTAATGFTTGASAPMVADSVVLTISAYGDARPRRTLHTFTLQDAVNPSKNPTWRAVSLITRADTVITTLPAQLLLGQEPSELTVTAQGETPNLRFELDLIETARDSLTRCADQGRMFELGRLRDGGVVFRVDGTRPPPCKRQARR